MTVHKLAVRLGYVSSLLSMLSYIGRKSQQPSSVLPTANTAKAWSSIKLLVFIVENRVQTTEYAPVLTYSQRFWYTV